jgi:simple sugar transport system permease protein
MKALTNWFVWRVIKNRAMQETFIITLAALLVSVVVFSLFMMACTAVTAALLGEGRKVVMPGELLQTMIMGGFGTRSAWQYTLSSAAPLILTALCTALPARLGLVVIGAEGALLAGAIGAVSVGLALPGLPTVAVQVLMALAGMLAGGLVIALVGGLSHARGVNATISSLLIAYVIIEVFKFLVEGPMRDPATLNKPSTYAIVEDLQIGVIPVLKVHWGLAFGVVFCLLSYVLMEHTTFGFSAQMAGGNIRAAQGAGLPVGRLILTTCFLGGAAAGLAGMVEVAAVHYQASASLIAGYGFSGILVSFIARHHPLAIIPTAILFGGLNASSGSLQRRLQLPDASVQVLMGFMFVMILLFETLYGRFRVFQPREVREVATA